MGTREACEPELVGDAFALVLAGGNGTRLGELTRWQCKPAIPFGGQFRNIDFTLSNCINSGLRQVAVLTQYKAQSLIAHITAGWDILPRALGEFVDVWPAQQRLHPGWYAGTADAVFQNLDMVLGQKKPHTLVLAGDHVYRMDYGRLLRHHVECRADVTIACVRVPQEDASSFGVIDVGAHHDVRGFIEKPAAAVLAANGEPTVLASMGIYVFDSQYLASVLARDALRGESGHDFGSDILPDAVREARVFAYSFTEPDGRPGYWRDVGTLESYWQAHMELLAPEPHIDLHDPAWPFRTNATALAPARVICNAGQCSAISSSLLSGGTLVRGAQVTSSVLSPNVSVGEGTVLEEVVALPNVRIGSNCRLRRVVIASEVQVADGTVAGGGRVSLLTGELPRPDLRCVA